MVGFLLTFFIVSIFDWIQMIKEKRRKEMFLCLIISVLVVLVAYFAYSSNFNDSFTQLILKLFNMKE